MEPSGAPAWLRRAGSRASGKLLTMALKHPTCLVFAPLGVERMVERVSSILRERYERNPVSSTLVAGFTLYLNPQDRGFISYRVAAGTFEIPITEIFRQVVRPGDCVVDVGANVGYYTLLSAALCGPTGHVLAFEPHPANFALLGRALEANHVRWALADAHAISDEAGSVPLFLPSSERLTGQASITRTFAGESIDVPATTLDAFLAQRGVEHVRLLKVDVEGAEPKVIAGSSEYLRQGKVDCIVLEWNPESWKNHKELSGLLEDRYDIYPVSDSKVGLSATGISGLEGAQDCVLVRRGSDLAVG